MLVFIRKLSLSTVRWELMCQGFSHFSVFLHHLVLVKLAISTMRAKFIWIWWKFLPPHLDVFLVQLLLFKPNGFPSINSYFKFLPIIAAVLYYHGCPLWVFPSGSFRACNMMMDLKSTCETCKVFYSHLYELVSCSRYNLWNGGSDSKHFWITLRLFAFILKVRKKRVGLVF